MRKKTRCSMMADINFLRVLTALWCTIYGLYKWTLKASNLSKKADNIVCQVCFISLLEVATFAFQVHLRWLQIVSQMAVAKVNNVMSISHLHTIFLPGIYRSRQLQFYPLHIREMIDDPILLYLTTFLTMVNLQEFSSNHLPKILRQ